MALQQLDPHLPPARRLRVYAFDPSLDRDLKTMAINRSEVRIPWEEVKVGPEGEYVEVVDVDPASRCVYEPVDLNDTHLVAQDGLPPSEGNPQFHQQMAYAVVMLTVANFERSLGRTVHWSPRLKGETGDWLTPERSYVPRLRIYPHALREANAYYSPEKKALLFGYFNARTTDPREGLPGGMVFSCLSHDIIAHETTHAVLDGIHRRMLEPTNPDVLAFHEAFADIVAIFQHFTLPGVLEHQIAHTRGELETENLLAKLAIQFGHATGRGNALRDAMGSKDLKTGEWKREEPNPDRLGRTHEPHARGALLVAAVFDAFLTIYRQHVADLRRIASGGSGILPEGDIHPDLVGRFAAEARKAASRVLNICIRALDYLPPVDVTFGDYLRAIITGDIDMVPDDERHYRVALIRSFRDWGIYPRGVRTLAVESLLWPQPSESDEKLFSKLLPRLDILRTIVAAQDYPSKDLVEQIDKLSRKPRSSEELSDAIIEAFRRTTREERSHAERRKNEYLRERLFAWIIHDIVATQAKQGSLSEAEWRRADANLGLNLRPGQQKFEVHAVRPIYRMRPDGRSKPELLVSMTQRSVREFTYESPAVARQRLHFKFRGGCTLLIDPVTGSVRFSIAKGIEDEARLRRQVKYYSQRLYVEGPEARRSFGAWGTKEKPEDVVTAEPFALLHRSNGLEEWL